MKWERWESLTKERALFMTSELWKLVLDNFDKHGGDIVIIKYKLDVWKRNGGGLDKMSFDCPCCEYVGYGFNSKTLICYTSCPLIRLWDTGGIDDTIYEPNKIPPCNNFENSPYRKILRGENILENITRIIEYSKAEYEKLKRSGQNV